MSPAPIATALAAGAGWWAALLIVALLWAISLARRDPDTVRRVPSSVLRELAGRARFWRPNDARLWSTLGFAGLLALVLMRAQFDSAIAAAAQFDLAPYLARVEGTALDALHGALPNSILLAATAACGLLPLALAIGTACIPRTLGRPELGASWVLWAAAAIALPMSAFLPLSEPGASGLLAVVPQGSGTVAPWPVPAFDAPRDALVSLPLTALAAIALRARSIGAMRVAGAAGIALVVQYACAVTAGEAWLASLPIALVAGLVASKVAAHALTSFEH